jgi:hypothetical protein
MRDASKTPMEEIFEKDGINDAASRRFFASQGFLGLLEAPIGLFESLAHEYDSGLRDGSIDAPTIGVEEGKRWDKNALMRMVLLQLARMEYCHALSHLLRGHARAMHGHLRTMVESAGRAYLSKTDAELGELFFSPAEEDQKRFRDKTKSGAILPKDDPLTEKLNELFKFLSNMFHASLMSVVKSGNLEFKREDGANIFRSTMILHDAAADGENYFLLYAVWVMGLVEMSLRVFGSALSLPDGVWYRRIEIFHENKARRIKANAALVALVREHARQRAEMGEKDLELVI